MTVTKAAMAVFLALAIALTALPGIGSVHSVEAAPSCVSDDVWAHDLGGGSWWDQGYVIDVFGIPRDDGFFLYYDPFTDGFKSVRWRPQSLIDNGIRFGVSTGWAYSHPWWDATFWRYVYPC